MATSDLPATYLPSLAGLDRAVAVIIFSEIGDKTFLIAAILAMRHSRVTIFSAAFAALALMSVLSALLGTILPALLPRRWTTLAAALLFFVFGARMLQEGIEMDAGTGRIEEEMAEVQKEVETAEQDTGNGGAGNSIPLSSVEEGLASSPIGGAGEKDGSGNGPTRRPISPANGGAGGNGTPFKKRRRSSIQIPLPVPLPRSAQTTIREGVKNLAGLFFSPTFVQAFVLTFLAEWGDRSQITTIALAAAHNVYLVTLGTIIGHSICTGMAVLGGRWLATKISVKHVTLGGAVLFLIFGCVYSWETYYWDEAAEGDVLSPATAAPLL